MLEDKPADNLVLTDEEAMAVENMIHDNNSKAAVVQHAIDVLTTLKDIKYHTPLSLQDKYKGIEKEFNDLRTGLTDQLANSSRRNRVSIRVLRGLRVRVHTEPETEPRSCCSNLGTSIKWYAKGGLLGVIVLAAGSIGFVYMHAKNHTEAFLNVTVGLIVAFMVLIASMIYRQ